MADDRTELMELRRLAELEAKATVRAPKTEEKYDPTEGMSGYEKFAAGVGSGASRVFRRAGNLLTGNDGSRKPSSRFAGLSGVSVPRTDPSSFFSDESLAEQKRIDQPLSNTGWGTAGQVAGEFAATAPIGAAGSGVRALATAAKAGPKLAGTLGLLSEGGAQGLVTSEVGEAGKGSAVGAGITGALGVGGKLFNRALSGIVRKSSEAELLDTLAKRQGEDVFVPLAQAADDSGISGAVKKIYEKILPYVPGASKQLEKQKGLAEEKFRNVAMKEAFPNAASELPDMGKDVHTSMQALSDSFDKAYMDLAKDSSLRSNLLRTKIGLQKLAEKTGDERLLEPLGAVDDLLKQDFVRSSPEELAKYEALNDSWGKFLRVRKAAARTKRQGGQFSPTDLRDATKRMDNDAVLSAGKAPLQDLAEVGEKTIGRSSGYPSFLERSLAWGGLGGLSYLEPTAALALYGGGRALGSRAAQKTLMGDTSTQREIIKLLRENPRAATILRRGTQGAIIAEGNEDGER